MSLNGAQHQVIGAVSGALFEGAKVIQNREEYDLESAAPALGAAAVGGLIGGMIPDLLEPATNPNHRGFFHSVLIMVGLAVILYLLWEKKGKEKVGMAFLNGLAAGCGSHLLADSTTPKSLPLLS